MFLFPILFVVGYVLIALEHPVRLNKSATAMFLGGILWLLFFLFSNNSVEAGSQLTESLGSVASVLFFLMGAMSIVVVVDSYDGFSLITNRIKTNNIRVLLWQITFITFFMSAVLDNMTTSIIMVTLVRRILLKAKDRKFFAGMIIIAANAGGAFSPIGDVTTTMLWIKGLISGAGIMKSTFLPSVFAVLIPLLMMTFLLKGTIPVREKNPDSETISTERMDQYVVFFFGMFGLILVPVLKALLDIPPYMGMLFSLGLLWLVTDLLLRKKDNDFKSRYSISSILKKVDMSSILFFAGILFAVSTLECTGQLKMFADFLQNTLGNIYLVTFSLGLLSAIVDNVPLVAACMGMYDFPMDATPWSLIAYCAGTGGSLLIIGSAAGVATMGIEKISFGWYLRWITPIAVFGYIAGMGVMLLVN